MKQKFNKRKVALVGTGMVGMSYAYSMLNSTGVCDELLLIDANKEKAKGEAMDLNHGLAVSNCAMKIYSGEYSDCADADIVTICAGVPRKPGDSRLDLLGKNAEIFRSIIHPVMESGFDGCFLIATNPVDVMTYIAQKLSKMPANRVIGSGTALDSSRLCYLLGNYFDVAPQNVNAYVLGEHGDSGFVPYNSKKYDINKLYGIESEVKDVAADVIRYKHATYYSIGMVLNRITRAILNDERSVLPLSTMPTGQYGQQDVYIGLPCVVGKNGVRDILTLDLSHEELEKLSNSCKIIRDLSHSVGI